MNKITLNPYERVQCECDALASKMSTKIFVIPSNGTAVFCF